MPDKGSPVNEAPRADGKFILVLADFQLVIRRLCGKSYSLDEPVLTMTIALNHAAKVATPAFSISSHGE